jgi:Asp-tRNA(Asn)/Glu-tRNA(Gln) amidotransferase A subunit family amidase
MSELLAMTALDLLRSYAKRRISPVDVVEAALDRISRVNPSLNIFYLVDAESATAAAKLSERRWREGRPLGLLDGIPTGVKDALSLQGTPIYRGSAAFDPRATISDGDAPCVARMKEHGAIILGKTTMPDFGILASGYSSKHGITRNPWNPKCNPGGSSSGAAASIAAGINPIAVGTDIVGSIRLPASFCGLAGMKPSQYRVPYYFPNSPALVAGPMARTVADAALLMTVISEPDSRDFTAMRYDPLPYRHLDAEPVRQRIGFLPALGWERTRDAAVKAAVEAAARHFESVGHDVVAVQPPFSVGEDEPAADFYRVRTLTELDRYPGDVQARAGVILDWTRSARGMAAVDLFRAFHAMQQMRERVVALFADLDFMILPSVHVSPYTAEQPGMDGEDLFAAWSSNFIFNLTEQPAASVNCGFTETGLPIGLQIVGKRFDDLGVFRLAHQYEQANPMTRPWPTL